MTYMLNYSRKENLKENFKGNILIKNVSASTDYVYMPYNAINYNYGTNNGMKINKESSVQFSNNEREYEFQYYPNLVNIGDYKDVQCEIESIIRANSSIMLSSNNNITLMNNCKKYTDFVHDIYTKLPEEDALQVIKDKYSGRYNETRDVNECVKEAIAAVNDGTTYDLAPGKLPEGKDFVEYFLYENKKGYCTHFASAATVILRAMGVPTRYVEGYVIKKSDADNASLTSTEMLQKDKGWFIGEAEAIKEFGITKQQFDSISIDNYIFKRKTESTQCEVKTMKIKDTNAHAWIEVYIDSIGWITVDVTPGFGDNIQDVISKKVDKKEAVTSENNNSNDTKITSENTTDNNTSKETYTSKSESVQMGNYSMPSILKVIIILAGILFVIIVTLILRNRILLLIVKRVLQLKMIIKMYTIYINI